MLSRASPRRFFWQSDGVATCSEGRLGHSEMIHDQAWDIDLGT
jgi:hypothetical protein